MGPIPPEHEMDIEPSTKLLHEILLIEIESKIMYISYSSSCL